MYEEEDREVVVVVVVVESGECVVGVGVSVLLISVVVWDSVEVSGSVVVGDGLLVGDDLLVVVLRTVVVSSLDSDNEVCVVFVD